MSLIITLHGEEGIVMASDSRVTISNTVDEGGTKVVKVGVATSDTIYKTFAAADRIGLSYCGESTLAGVPLAGYVETFIREHIEAKKLEVESVPSALLAYFRSLPYVPDTWFHVAGYFAQEGVAVQKVWRVGIKDSFVDEVAPKAQLRGAAWNGETDILTRILNNRAHLKEPNGIYSPLPGFGVPFEMFTLQDMIDFAVYAIRATSDSMRFQMRPKTVGGPIDVLVIKPSGVTWIQRKKLEIR